MFKQCCCSFSFLSNQYFAMKCIQHLDSQQIIVSLFFHAICFHFLVANQPGTELRMKTSKLLCISNGKKDIQLLFATTWNKVETKKSTDTLTCLTGNKRFSLTARFDWFIYSEMSLLSAQFKHWQFTGNNLVASHKNSPLPVVWSPRGPVWEVSVGPDLLSHSTRGWGSWTHRHRPSSKEQPRAVRAEGNKLILVPGDHDNSSSLSHWNPLTRWLVGAITVQKRDIIYSSDVILSNFCIKVNGLIGATELDLESKIEKNSNVMCTLWRPLVSIHQQGSPAS